MSDFEIEKNFLKEKANRQQTLASNPKLSVWVEASAGTGKTKVLSDRVLRLLLEGVAPSKILCLTYTKAAAVEMNSRIYERLSKWVVAKDCDLESELNLLYGFSNAENINALKTKARTLFAKILDAPVPLKIQTIHSFCQEILKRFPIEAGVPPYFEVMDEQQTSEALGNLSKKVLLEMERFEAPDLQEAVLFLTQNMEEFSFKDLLLNLTKERTKLIKVISAFKNEASFLRALSQKLGFEGEPSKEKSLKLFERQIDKPLMKKCAKALLEGSKKDKEHGALLLACFEKFDFDVYRRVFLTQGGETLETLAHKDAVAAFENIENIMFLEAERVKTQIEILKNIRIYQTTKAVFTIAEHLIEKYRAYKLANACLDYEDLIVLVKNLLEKPDIAAWVLFKLDQGVDHILIDEAQDTSENQWAIVRALTDEFFSGLGQSQTVRTVFAVGDKKQSIYRFQGAVPEKFDEMRRFYEKNVPDFKTVHLDVSFRSTEAVLDAVNAVFSFDDAAKGLIYENQKVAHIAYRIGQASRVEMWELLEEAKDEKHDIWELPVKFQTKVSARSKLADKIALEIKRLVDAKTFLPSKGRTAQYKDFMILVQRRNAFIDEFIKAAKKIGVEVAGADRLKLMDQIVVEDLLSLAKFLLLPSDDLSLAEVLKSPLFSLDDDDLFGLCYRRGEMSLWQRLKQNEKYADITEFLSSLLLSADTNRPFELFSLVLDVFEGRKKFFSRLGRQAKDAIDEFMNLTLVFEANHVANLQNFVAWMGSFKTEVKRELEQSEEDAVRIMTVHGSKGLQAPVVILPDTLREPYLRRQRGALFEENMVYFPLSADDYNQNCENVYALEVEKNYDEYRRLLYVALTRAEDRLYIASYGKQKESVKNWFYLCQRAMETFAKKQGDAFVKQTPQLVLPQTEETKEVQKPAFKDTSFAYQKAPKEQALNKPFAPSHMQQNDCEPVASPLCDNGFYYKRGTLIHKLLELLENCPDISSAEKLIDAYFSKQKDVSAAFYQDIKTEILNLYVVPEFSFLFSADARAEVPVMGMVDGQIVSGQIDRLVVMKEKVLIVDFKTNRPAADTYENVPPAYVKQLEIYRKLLSRIYPQKQIETYILWTNTLKLMKI